MRALIMDYGGVLTDGAAMLDLARRARAAGIPTALVSDAPSVPTPVRQLFDVVVLGWSIGVRKPDPEVFRRVPGMLGVPPDECVVVDDLARNVRGARSAGAVGVGGGRNIAVHHIDPGVTVQEVEILLDLP